MRGRSLADLLQLPVVLRGIHLGRCVDVLIDVEGRRAAGFVVHCGDGADRFLPLGAAELGSSEILIRSALTLVEENELAFYRRRGSTLRTLLGTSVTRGSVAGTMEDLGLGDEGALSEIVVASTEGSHALPFDERVSLDAARVPA